MDLTQMEEPVSTQNNSTIYSCRNCGKIDKMDNTVDDRRGRGFESKMDKTYMDCGIESKSNNVDQDRTKKSICYSDNTSVAGDVANELNCHGNVAIAKEGNHCYRVASVIYTSANSHHAVCLVQSVIVTLFLLLVMSPNFALSAPELLQKQYSSSVYSSLSSQSNPDSAVESQEHPSLLPQLYRPLGSVSACNVQCKTSKSRQFCASDGKTYSSKCEIRRVSKCESKEIRFVSKGSCTDGREKTIGRHRVSPDCNQALRKIERAPNPSGEEVYRPVCNENGTYRAVQCYHGYCWCVQSDGTPIPQTSTKDGEPDCNKQSEDSKKKKVPTATLR